MEIESSFINYKELDNDILVAIKCLNETLCQTVKTSLTIIYLFLKGSISCPNYEELFMLHKDICGKYPDLDTSIIDNRLKFLEKNKMVYLVNKNYKIYNEIVEPIYRITGEIGVSNYIYHYFKTILRITEIKNTKILKEIENYQKNNETNLEIYKDKVKEYQDSQSEYHNLGGLVEIMYIDPLKHETFLTSEGYANLELENYNLNLEKENLIKQKHNENFNERIFEIETKIKMNNNILYSGTIIEEKFIEFVHLGNTVKVKYLNKNMIATIKIVDENEVDINKKQFSYKSPLGKAILFKMVGEIGTFKTVDGRNIDVEIIEIS